MHVVDRGRGTPLVIVPGIQGRWEYMRAAVDRLAEHFRVLTFSLSDERSSGRRHRHAAPRPAQNGPTGFDDFVDQIDAVLDDRRLSSAIVCGVSFGGLVALRFAARRPERAEALVLVSTPGPGWHLRRRHEVYARLPWVFGPFFFAETPWRMRDELRAAFPDRAARRQFRRDQLRTLLQAPVSVSRMAARARMIGQLDSARECAQVTCPTLVVTGDPALDHVIAARGESPYRSLIPHAQAVVMPNTGHLGLVTKPDEFSLHVKAFVEETRRARDRQRGRHASGSTHDAA